MLKRIVAGLVMGGLAIVGLTQSASAQAVNYQILKYGTNQISYASAYFLNPANVSVDKNNYRVSLTVATKHELGRFPVKVQNVNGQAPQISESTQGNMDYYTFTFTAKDLSPKMTGAMHVDVDSLDYHHQYSFNLKFDTHNLPALNTTSAKAASNSSTTNSEATSQASSTQSSTSGSQATSQASSTQSSTSGSQATSQASDPQSSTSGSQATSQTSSTQSSTSGSQAALAETKVNAANATQTNKGGLKGSIWAYAVGGVIVGGILIALLKYITSRQKKN